MQLAEVVIGFLTPFQEKFNSLSDEEVLKILEEGSRKVEKLAKLKMKEIKEKIGFIV